MTNSDSTEPNRKLKFEGSEYDMDSLPESVKQTFLNPNTADSELFNNC